MIAVSCVSCAKLAGIADFNGYSASDLHGYIPMIFAIHGEDDGFAGSRSTDTALKI